MKWPWKKEKWCKKSEELSQVYGVLGMKEHRVSEARKKLEKQSTST
jgi:hypothetical protein